MAWLLVGSKICAARIPMMLANEPRLALGVTFKLLYPSGSMKNREAVWLADGRRIALG
jgi:hypothetical protein